MAEQKETQSGALMAGGLGGGLAGFFLGLIAARPALAATPEDKLNYLVALVEAIGVIMDKLYQGQLQSNKTLQDILGALTGEGGAPGFELTVRTRWVGKEPVQLFTQAVRSAGTFTIDVMVNWTQGKRLLLKAESSLDQVIQLQPIGNIVESLMLATNVGPPVPCAANGNASIGFAWDDWQPYIGLTITIPIAPTTGILTIFAVQQE